MVLSIVKTTFGTNKTHEIKRTTSSIALVLALGGCRGDDKNATSKVSVTATDAAVVADVKSSNIDFFPFNRPAGTWRWSATPVPREDGRRTAQNSVHVHRRAHACEGFKGLRFKCDVLASRYDTTNEPTQPYPLGFLSSGTGGYTVQNAVPVAT